ncbi:MAG TPA: phytoene desaturase family protein [Myxococcaceae bacterium]|nr:phytoene desaturase family protein [Myxococcaceae bacterium]
MARRLSAIVVGAGVGGLAAAARLAHAGFDVQVLEQTAEPGGRCGQLQAGGYTFDLGPTILLMPEVVERTFGDLGVPMASYLRLHRCDPNDTLRFRDGASLTFTSDLARMKDEVERLEPGSFPRFLRFLALGQLQYRTSLDRFAGRDLDHLGQFLTPASLAALVRVRGHRRLYSVVSDLFHDERLRAALTFQTMYLGLSPYESPAVYGLLPYSELGVGIWFPEGGLHALPRALERLALETGARLAYRTRVTRIDLEGNRATGVTLEDGTHLPADLVLCNADLPWAYRNLVDPSVTRLRRADRLRYTSSGYLLYLGLDRRVPELGHHTVFFGSDYRGSFEDIFRRFRVPADPSFYVAVASRTDPSLAPPGRDGLYVLVPVPRQHPSLDWTTEGPRVRAQVFRRLREEGLDVERHIVVERRFTPDDWASRFSLEHGSAFGLGHQLFQVGPFRPPNQDPTVRNLFFVGASTRPGTGLPMVMLSAELVVERMRREALALGATLAPRAALGQEVPA